MTVRTTLQSTLTNPADLLGWGLLVAASLGMLIRDLRSNSGCLGSPMESGGFTVLARARSGWRCTGIPVGTRFGVTASGVEVSENVSHC